MSFLSKITYVFFKHDQQVATETATDKLSSYVVYDTETTGLYPESGKIIEIAAIRVIDGKIDKAFSSLIKYGSKLKPAITRITGISDDDLKSAPDRLEVLLRFKEFIGDLPLVGHNIIDFDNQFLYTNYDYVGLEPPKNKSVDTLILSRDLFSFNSYKLTNICNNLGIVVDKSHRAADDAKLTLKLFLEIKSRIDIEPVETIRKNTKYRSHINDKYIKRNKDIDNPAIRNKIFCITTFSPFYKFKNEDELKQFIVDSGGEVGNLTMRTDYLIDCDPGYNSIKERRASVWIDEGKSSIKIISPDQFVSIIDNYT